MIRKINNLLPISYIVLGLWLFFPVTSKGLIHKEPPVREPSQRLQKKMQSLCENRASCGKDNLCRMYGQKFELDEQNSLKFIAFVNTLSGKK
ncbi:MAG: hypothetical protein HKP55_14635 [Gammaproteobacteria bacterium]|nr:hypothetical protein [Gammaproteobacteria bacterium]NNJ92910.1 hypothetical protein [Gammaproteobacteria bacterium]